MPTLKQLTCNVEWELSQTPLQEFQTTYSDGYVETYLAVPELPTPFSIHLQSNGYIAPGLSMFVYIDGVYQCNRNRQNLKIPDENTTKKQTEVNFRVRQREQMSENGTFYGKPWKFERVNIQSGPNVTTNERVPYDGEYVGTIEVVVLRCYPSLYTAPSFNSAETLVNRRPSSLDSSSSDSDDFPAGLDGAGDPKSRPIPSSRPAPRSQIFGLDGFWDDVVPSGSAKEGKKKSQDSWGELPVVTEGPANTSWGDWDKPTSAIDDNMSNQAASRTGSVAGSRSGSNSNKFWGSWNQSSSAKDEPESKRRTSRAGSKTGSTHGSRSGSNKNQSWGNWDEPSTAKDEQNKGTVEMTSANTGVYHPPSESSSSKAASKAAFTAGSMAGSKAESTNGSRSGSQSSQSWGLWNKPSSTKGDPNNESFETTNANTVSHNLFGGGLSNRAASKAGSQSGSQGNRSRKAPSATGHLTPRTLELRGGGTSSYSVRSRRGSANDSPIFNVGFYNGVKTPPPLDQGPPPPRDWRTEEAAKKGRAKQGQKATAEPIADGWGDLPNDNTAGVEPDSQGKVDDWNAGGSDMPGAWGTSNDQKKDNDGWGATEDKGRENNDSWGAPADGNQDNDASKDAGNDWNWGANSGDAQDNGTWPGAGKASDWDEPTKDDAGQNDTNGEANSNNDSWGGNENNETQTGDNWNGNDTNNVQNDNDWNTGNGDGGNNIQSDGWGNHDAEDKETAGNKQASGKGSKKGSKAGSGVKGSMAGSAGKAASVKSKGKWASPKGQGSSGSSKNGAGPRGWSPTPRSKKGTPQRPSDPAATDAQAQLSFSMSTAPKAKQYWSAWKNPNGVEEEITVDEPILRAEEPLYTIPEDVAARNNMSHQVRPGRPMTYTHKISRPKYMDTHENPYAIFAFHYRDKAIIEDILQTTIEEPGTDEKQRLASLPKAELIEELLKEKARSASGSAASEKAATFRSNPHGIPLGPNVSALKAKLSKLEGSKAATPDMVGAWVDSAHGNGNGNNSGSTNVKGNWGKKNKNQGKKSAGGDGWGSNGGAAWGNDNGNTAGNARDNNANDPTNDNKQEDEKNDNDGNWGGFDQDAGAASGWGNDEKKDEGGEDANSNANANGGGWGEVTGGGGGGGGW